ncbi:31-O-demethyl-FK506 methyltransferase FkbM [Defluviimonas aquaemixtae]|uniref:31-O-demethyl-FK506 methyltransferase FkbM n=1 Tax=Albidovulum aquaemixtae TaxID=1542388 RepID=A0A2R8B441_9RHOB|nr:FkbM family methyltransferase [Defluviimonas aquaemixtae]SPH17394.1 31-O-demethyl-FK506 methyltransferase FkbM [Defluviimonas aquaemixtae]
MAELSVEEELAKLKRRQARNMRHAHAQGLMQGILSMLRPGDVVLDCGANVGAVTGPLAATGADVHSYEPDPWAFGVLSSAFADTPNVTLHNAAVGTSAGAIQLMRADNFDKNPKGASVKSTIVTGGRRIDEAEGSAIEVALVDLPATIRELVRNHGEIAFLKMDIEGAELELLETMLAEDLFAQIRLTVAETHEKKFRDLAPRFAELRRAVAERYPATKVNLDWI